MLSELIMSALMSLDVPKVKVYFTRSILHPIFRILSSNFADRTSLPLANCVSAPVGEVMR